MKKLSHKIKGFTIIELIVVIAILAILGTIGVVSYTSYLSTSRDATRISQIQIIYQAIESVSKGKAPAPEKSVRVYANGLLIGYQGYAGDNVLGAIGINDGGRDPSTGYYYTYSVDSKFKNVQFLVFLEDYSNAVSHNKLINQTNAALDYSKKFIRTYGAKLGILVDQLSQTPIQEIPALITTGLDVVTTTGSYNAYFSTDKYISGNGTILQVLQQSINYGGIGFGAPKSCPEGYIAVPGNEDFNQSGFCVMKYEATYLNAVVPDTVSGGATSNTVVYTPGKAVISKPGLYPIADITQKEAIDACKSIGVGYHLITNKEWMSLARNIELTSNNWSGNSVSNGVLYGGINNNIPNTAANYGCPTGESSGSHLRQFVSSSLNYDTTKWGSSKGTDCDSKRQLMLSNGEIIWDLSGNVGEHVNRGDSINPTNAVVGPGSYCSSNGFWYTNGFPANAPNASNVGPTTENIRNGSHRGMGYYTNGTGTDKVFIRGGGPTDTLNQIGIYNLLVDKAASYKHKDVGFRCAK